MDLPRVSQVTDKPWAGPEKWADDLLSSAADLQVCQDAAQFFTTAPNMGRFTEHGNRIFLSFPKFMDERQGERERDIYIYTYAHTLYIIIHYIYIYCQ